MPGTNLWARFTIHECDSENVLRGVPVGRCTCTSDVLKFEPERGKLYAVRYEGRYYSFSEFKRLVEQGEIV